MLPHKVVPQGGARGDASRHKASGVQAACMLCRVSCANYINACQGSSSSNLTASA